MNRRIPIRKPHDYTLRSINDGPPPIAEYVIQKHPLWIYGDDKNSNIVSVRIQDSSCNPPLTATLHYNKKDYKSKGLGNVYKELEKELDKQRVQINEIL